MTATVEPAGNRRPTPHGRPRERPRWADERPPLERSPVHLFTLLNGLVIVVVGWGAATLFERGLTAVSLDLTDLVRMLPQWAEQVPRGIASLGTFGVVLAVPVWLVQDRRFRDLALVAVAAAVAVGLSLAMGQAVEAVMRPETRAPYEVLPPGAARTHATDPTVAAAIAVVTVVRRRLSPPVRWTVYSFVPVWLLANASIEPAPPYLGLVLDLGLGLVAGSAVALALRTSSLRPTPGAIAAGLAANRLTIATLEPAAVDARGSTPWLATTTDGRALFVKALSHEQRDADLMFRGMRWLRLRRTGDPPPDSSLRRSAEHEAFVAHHARALGVATPAPLAVADIGQENVALVYEAVAGRSLDRVERGELTDDVLHQAWRLVAVLRSHAISHRDLRLANILLADDGRVLLVDFGFAELSADQQALDTDVAELLTATAIVVGVPRAVRAARTVLGPEPLSDAREWLEPLALSGETRHAAQRAQVLEPLHDEVSRVTGAEVEETEPLGRLHFQRLIGPASIAVTLYALISGLVRVTDPIGAIDWGQAVAALGLSLVAYPAAGMSVVAATGNRLGLRDATRAVLLSRLPVTSPTGWSHAARVVAAVSRRAGLRRLTRRRAVARWISAGLAVSPVLVAAATLAAGRRPLGYPVATALGAACGGGLALVQYVVLHHTPWGRDFERVWLDARSGGRTDRGRAAATLLWAGAASIVEAAAVLLAARAVGYGASASGVLALVFAVSAVARLLPARGGVGVFDGLLLSGLAVADDVGTAALAVVVARLATYWLHLPAAWLVRVGDAEHTEGSP